MLALYGQFTVCKSHVVFALLPALCAVCVSLMLCLPAMCCVCKSCMCCVCTTASAMCCVCKSHVVFAGNVLCV